MKIIDILISGCELLGLNDEREILSQTTDDNEQTTLANEEIKNLYNLLKFSLQELCSNYVPISTTQNFTTSNKKYNVGNLTNFVRMQSVFKGDEEIEYKLINRYITMEEDGEYTAKYFTYPQVQSLFDDVDFLETLSPDVIVFGLCSYYSLSHGMFEDFEILHNHYIEKADSLKTLKVFDLPQRRWE